MSYKVFISHSSLSNETAMKIVAKLENAGIDCWVAPRDLSPGDDWAEGIINGIESCPLFLLLLCPEANESPQVLREVERAVNKKIPVIPFLTEDITLSKSLEYFVSSHHWQQINTPPSDDDLANITDIMAKKLGQTPPPREKTKAMEPEKKINYPLWGSGAVACLLSVGIYLWINQPAPVPVPPPDIQPGAEQVQVVSEQKPATQPDNVQIQVVPDSDADFKPPGDSTEYNDKDAWKKIEVLVKSADYNIDISTSKETLKVGEPVVITCTPHRDGHLTIFSHSLGSGKVEMIFPNRVTDENFVEKDQQISIPDNDDNFEFIADNDLGGTLVVAFLHPNNNWLQDLKYLQRADDGSYRISSVARGLTVRDLSAAGSMEIKVVADEEKEKEKEEEKKN